MVIRLADLYLMQAEAWNEVGNNNSKVLNALNIVRERAGLLSVEEAWTQYSSNPTKYQTQEGLRSIIHQERTIEMAFEGNRYWDLKRWKIAHEIHNKPIMGWNVFGTNAREFYRNFTGPKPHLH